MCGFSGGGKHVMFRNYPVKQVSTFISSLVAVAIVAGVAAITPIQPTSTAHASDSAQPIKKGRETGLPIPRFVSLKAQSVRFRVGPGKQYEIAWLYKKRGLPVEVIQEFDRWRRVRDADGTTGWVLHSLLAARRTAVVAPWDRELDRQGRLVRARIHAGHRKANSDAAVKARFQAGVVGDLVSCQGGWCELKVDDMSAWMPQSKLWGTYPGEPVEG